MKVLLDENLPHKLHRDLPGVECVTTRRMGWSGVSNGRLLRAAADAGFHVMLTLDRRLSYQQNLAQLPLSVIVLHPATGEYEDVRKMSPMIMAALEVVGERELVTLRASSSDARRGPP